MQTVEWVKEHILPSGGLEAWSGYGKPYPECTGYIIPSLLQWGETEAAETLGKWLLTVQNPNGSFMGLDGVARPFDTAAALEGLRALGYDEAAAKATSWLESMLHDGLLRIHPGTLDTHIYNIRALAKMGNKLDGFPLLPNTRTHYIAYALEGLYEMGFDITANLQPYVDAKSLLPFEIGGGGSDTCATAQIAVLCLKNNTPCDGLIEAVRSMIDTDGGVLHGASDRRKCAWTAKYTLDMEYLCKNMTSTGKTGKTKKFRSA